MVDKLPDMSGPAFLPQWLFVCTMKSANKLDEFSTKNLDMGAISVP